MVKSDRPERIPPSATDAETASPSATAQAPEKSNGQSAARHAVDASPQAHPAEFYLVGIGASAGGLEPIEKFFENMPTDSGMAFVVVQHLSPDFRSLMDELLARKTKMAIRKVEEGMEVTPNTVFLIPPKMEMAIRDNRFTLTEQVRAGALSLPIDIFFESLATAFGSRAIAVILSGTGTDGSRGIQHVHEAGGLTIVQDPETARFDGMPNSAIGSGLIDWVIAPEQIPEGLVRYIKSPSLTRQEWNPAPSVDCETPTARIQHLLRDAYGVDFSCYKQETVSRRLERRLALSHHQSLDEYVDQLAADPHQLSLLYHDLLIGVTHFFRDPPAFQVLADTVIPELLSRKPAREPARFWIAGCGTGEEAYSVAMLLHELFVPERPGCDIKIFATDVDRRSLEFAAAGLYPERSLADLSPERRERYFSREGDAYRVNKELRRLIVFAPHNLVSDAPFTKIDLITCCNLLIYLTPLTQKKVLSLFHFALRPGGTLLLGPSESVGELANEFTATDAHWKVFRKVRDARLTHATRSVLTAPATVRQPVVGNYVALPDPRLIGAYDALLDSYIPAGVLINARHEVVHTFGDTRKLLHPAKGRATLDLLDMVDPDLRLILGAAIQKVERTEAPVTYDSITVCVDDAPKQYTIVVRPVGRTKNEPYLFVLFEPLAVAADQPPAATESLHIGEVSHQRIRALEEELQRTKEHLQATIEELEASNEELQATNEELVSSNEELQSTNQELHSVNEELYTVNTEYRQKIVELTELSNDIENLMASTQIGTVFLDSSLCIRKFTPAVTESFNLRPQDVGRPISDFANNLRHPGFLNDLRRVLDDGRVIEREVQAREGVWFLVRVLPYTTQGGTIGGVVVTFINLSEVKRAESALRVSEAGFTTAFTHAPIGMGLASPEGHWLKVNPALCEIVGATPRDMLAHRVESIIHADDLEQYRQNVAGLLRGDIPVAAVQSRCLREGNTAAWTIVSQSLVRDANDKPLYFVVQVQDITRQKRTEQELRTNEERLRLVEELATDGMWDWNLQTQDAYLSARWKSQLGYNAIELPNRTDTWRSVIHPDDLPAVERALQDHLERRTPFSLPVRFRRKDGSLRWFMCRGQALADDAGAFVRMVGTHTDITELKETEAALRDSETRFRQLAENIQEVFWMTTADGRDMIYVSPAYANIWGRGCTDLMDNPLSWMDCIHDEDRARVRDAFFSTVQRGEFSEEFRITRPDGSRRWVHSRGFPVRDDDGNVYRIAGIAEDITDRKLIEQRFRIFVEGAPVATLMINRRGEIVQMNQEVERLFGYEREELLDQPIEILVPPALRAAHVALRDGFLAQPERRSLGHRRDLLATRRDGSEFVVEIGLSPVEAFDNEYVLATVIDVTERIDNEERLRQTNAELARTIAELDEFTYVASHDLQEPLRKMATFSELLAVDVGPDLPEKAKVDLHFIKDGAVRMQRLVEDLLVMSRTGRAELASERVNLDTCLDDALEALSLRITELGATINREALPIVQGDKRLLTQIFQNLISNALKFRRPDAAPVVHVTAERNGGNYWTIVVRDDGIGFDPKYADQIFAPFRRLHGRDKYEGSGIGLSICRKGIERMGGRIWAEPGTSGGATFRFELPSNVEGRRWERGSVSEPSSS